MKDFRRYAVYHVPRPGPLADRAAAWLGWDISGGLDRAQPEVAGLPRPLCDLTEAPRKYGFHGTIKPPFRLLSETDAEALARACEALAARLPSVVMPGLRLAGLGGFLALVPDGGEGPLREVAAEVVRALDPFRAAPDATETARRRPETLSAPQRQNLERWGYPYVMDEFRFHLTLTGPLTPAEERAAAPVVAAHFADALPAPFVVADLCLCGEGGDGRFRLIHRYTLSG